jgi:hypothetical protein
LAVVGTSTLSLLLKTENVSSLLTTMRYHNGRIEAHVFDLIVWMGLVVFVSLVVFANFESLVYSSFSPSHIQEKASFAAPPVLQEGGPTGPTTTNNAVSIPQS